jgi:glycine C-acetyltransferase
MFGVRDRVDIVSGTLGKALGGASGGYISSHQEIVDLLRQRARPYLFSNSIPPTVIAGSLVALDLVASGQEMRAALHRNAANFRAQMTASGFNLLPGEHPIIPVMFADEHEAARMATALFELGIYVVAFSYPVVPMGKARIRVQICATHSQQDIDQCVAAFVAARGI